jgi:phage anti-repressor protein
MTVTKGTEPTAPTVELTATGDATAGTAQPIPEAPNRKGEFVMQDDLFEVATRSVGEDLVPTTDARSLHTFLENGDHFATWIKQRIEQFDFEEGIDYVTHNVAPTGKGGRPSKEFALTLGMAKELSMVERNARGKQARRYFIDCEKYARELFLNAPPAPVAPAIEDIRNAEAVIAQRDIALAYHLEQAQRLTGKLFRAVKPPKPRAPKALPPPDDRTRVALDSLLDLCVSHQGTETQLREVLRVAVAPVNDVEVRTQHAALNTLKSQGILLEGKMVLFGTGVPFLQTAAEKLYGDRQGLRQFLITVPGSTRTDVTKSFGGAKSKAVMIPLSALFPRAAEAS